MQFVEGIRIIVHRRQSTDHSRSEWS